MRLLIFGSTGSIGRQLVEQALEQGHLVTAFVRNPAKANWIDHPNLRIFQGNVLTIESVTRALDNQQAVLCALGDGRKGYVRSAGTLNIIRAMEQTSVKRFICQTSLGVGDSWNSLNFFWKHIMFGWFLKLAFMDHEQQENYIRASSLDWVIARPAAFTDGNLTGHYRHGFDATAKGLTLKISRADVANLMLKQLENDTYLQQAPGLSY